MSKRKIVRTLNAGVFFGFLKRKKHKQGIITDARRLWYWDGASTLSELAQHGTARPENCKFPCAVDRIRAYDICEVLDVTEKAEKSIMEVPEWKQRP